MTGLIVTRVVKFRSRSGSRAVAPASPAVSRRDAALAKPSPAARLLALAYAIERDVASGAVRDYREAARRLGLAHSRVSQITALRLLAPSIQADILHGLAAPSEYVLRRVVANDVWTVQATALAS